mmetsp:Transcript_3575/g.4875  ORF Transcript_3575/g.4875 Transcript_3575/m.4875 type:complete len:157 (-) Transcript_3575:57-527(-)
MIEKLPSLGFHRRRRLRRPRTFRHATTSRRARPTTSETGRLRTRVAELEEAYKTKDSEVTTQQVNQKELQAQIEKLTKQLCDSLANHKKEVDHHARQPEAAECWRHREASGYRQHTDCYRAGESPRQDRQPLLSWPIPYPVQRYPLEAHENWLYVC